MGIHPRRRQRRQEAWHPRQNFGWFGPPPPGSDLAGAGHSTQKWVPPSPGVGKKIYDPVQFFCQSVDCRPPGGSIEVPARPKNFGTTGAGMFFLCIHTGKNLVGPPTPPSGEEVYSSLPKLSQSVQIPVQEPLPPGGGGPPEKHAWNDSQPLIVLFDSVP